jgi:hypothetical protein
MTLSTFDLVVGLAGLASLGFNVLQLYQDRVRRTAARDQRALHTATLEGIALSLEDTQILLNDLQRKGAPSDAIERAAAAALTTQRHQIRQLLSRYYEPSALPRAAHATTASLGSVPVDQVAVVSGMDAITDAMVMAVEQADNYIIVVGGRSRNDRNLDAVARRVARGDVRYVRTLTGDHIRHPLCLHLDALAGKVELAHLTEDKYGGILVTSETVVVALQSSRVGALDKGLVVKDQKLAADYRTHALELYHSATTVPNADYYRQLCTTCRKGRIGSVDAT